MLTKKTLGLLVSATATLTLLAGCGNNDTDPAATKHTAAGGEVFNDADVTFATDMIQHHAQALLMVDLSVGRNLDPAVEQLAETIRESQTPEVQAMSGWLTDWGEPVPETALDHAHGDMGTMSGMNTDMPGMMSDAQMADLDAAKGSDFQQMWLEMMIEHHQGAIEMAQTEQADGLSSDAVDLASLIEGSQGPEIEQMNALLGS